MGYISFNSCNFRAQFSAYADVTAFPDAVLNGNFTIATVYITNRTGGCYCGGLTPLQQTQALYLMTAHLLALNALIASGQTPGILTAATIDKISVTIEPPPAANQWQYWLQTTPYGQQLLALLLLAGVGGIYATTGAPGRAGFRFSGVW